MTVASGARGRETLTVLYRDEHMVVVDKPSGLLVHRSPIDRHEIRFVLQIVRDQVGQRVYPVHRLDKPTSGALTLALNPDAARVLATAFATGTVNKTYVAVVRGWPPLEGSIERPLAAVEDERIGAQATEPREASTGFRRLEAFELPVRVDRYPTSRYALVELRPRTGRRHQLRRHLAGASYPVIGDSTYGKGRHNRLFATTFGSSRLLLACTRLEFSHAPCGASLVVDAPLAPDFAAVLERLQRDYCVPQP